MSIGKDVADARAEITQEQLAMDLHVSREAVSKYETGARKIPKDLRPRIAGALDEPGLYLGMANEATGGVSIPYLNGEHIDRHLASLKDMTQRETDEALDHLERACMVKPVDARTDQEREEIKQVVMELLDAAASIKNLVVEICKQYDFSMKEIYKAWTLALIARKWKKRG